MKKIFYCALSAAVLTAGLSSCGKSSKGKMSNEWKVTEYNSTSTDIDSDNDKTVHTITMTETAFTETSESTPDGGSTTTTTSTGTVNTNTMTIDKDGTWKSTREISSASANAKTTMTASGTWSFVGKTKGDEFKKNERVLFNTLAESTTSSYTIGGITTTGSSSDTYMTGENVMIYTVIESKGSELKLEAEMGNTYTSGNNTSTSKGKTTITLAEK